MSAVPIGGDDAKCENSQIYTEILKEAEAKADMQGDGKTVSTSANLVENDVTLVNTVLPPRNAVHGTFTFLS